MGIPSGIVKIVFEHCHLYRIYPMKIVMFQVAMSNYQIVAMRMIESSTA